MAKEAMPGDGPQADRDGLDDASLRQFIGYNIRRAWLALQDDRNQLLVEMGLRTVSFSALTLIVDNPDIIQSRLAEALRMERSNIVVVVDELEGLDLIARGRSAQDRRVYTLRATLKGRRLRDAAVAALRRHEDRMTARLAESERRLLVNMLNRIEAQEREARK